MPYWQYIIGFAVLIAVGWALWQTIGDPVKGLFVGVAGKKSQQQQAEDAQDLLAQELRRYQSDSGAETDPRPDLRS